MKFVRKAFILVFAVISVGFIAALAVDRYLESLLCGETQIEKSISPNGMFVAVMFSRDCGATTPTVTKVGVRRKLWNGVYTWQTDVFAISHQDVSMIRWIDNDRLVISYRGGDVSLKRKGALGVKIELVETPRQQK